MRCEIRVEAAEIAEISVEANGKRDAADGRPRLGMSSDRREGAAGIARSGREEGAEWEAGREGGRLEAGREVEGITSNVPFSRIRASQNGSRNAILQTLD